MTDLGKKALYLLFLLPLSLVLATAVTGSSNYLFLLVMASIIFFSVLTSFRNALILIGIASYFLSYGIWYFHLPEPLINLGYILIIMVLMREFFFKAGLLPVRTPVNRLLVAIVAVGFLSIAAGDSGTYASFKGMLRHIGFPLLFILVLVAEPDERLMKRLVIGILIVAFLQIIASAWQFTYYSTIAPKPPGMRADYSGGLLGFSCGAYNAVFLAMAFCLMLGFILVYGFSLTRAAAAAVLMIPIYLASARAGVFFFALSILFMLVVAPLPRHGPFSRRLLLAAGLLVVMFIAGSKGLLGPSFKAVFNPSYVYEYSYGQSDAGMGRFQAFEVISEHLRNPMEKLIGRGPGMLTPTSISGNPNSLIASDPELFKNVTGYAYTMLELGYAGLILFLLMYLQVYRFTREFLRSIDDPFWESIAVGFSGAIFVYVFSTFYVDSWIFYPLPFTFWALAAAIYRVGVIRGILTV